MLSGWYFERCRLRSAEIGVRQMSSFCNKVGPFGVENLLRLPIDFTVDLPCI